MLLSSHLLDEVEKCCDLVAVIDHGSLVTQGTPAALAAGSKRRIAIDCEDPARAELELAGLPGVAEEV